jgi:hypothetical protein
MMKTKLWLVACAILLVMSVNASATMAPVARQPKVPALSNNILLLISGLEIYGPVAITDCRLKLSASSLELNISLDSDKLPAEIYHLIVNTIDNICPNQYSNIFTTSLEVIPEPTALLILSPNTTLTKELK